MRFSVIVTHAKQTGRYAMHAFSAGLEQFVRVHMVQGKCKKESVANY
jgi:hypothetical protein